MCGVAFTFSAAKTVFTGSKTAYDLASKARGAPHDLAALRDSLRMLKRPIALCADLGTRHKVGLLFGVLVFIMSPDSIGCSVGGAHGAVLRKVVAFVGVHRGRVCM